MINFIEITNELFKNSFVNKLTVEVVSLRLLLAVVFGGIVGYTREKDNKPAGFRTHILVCFGAAVISMVQDQLRLNILELASVNLKLTGVIKTDLGRLGAQVVSGIGFLGAGSIMKEKGETVGGMTTAAGIWATGCAGLGIGWGFYNLAIPAIVFMLVIIVIFKKFEPKIVKKTKLLKFEVKFLEDKNYAKGLLATYEVFNQKLIKITQIDKNQPENTAIFTVNMDEKIDISDVIVSLSAIKAVEVVKENYN
ncbi:MgtC/SapB family protein [uncultured Leptotrichia sp.]|jgi:Mg(2+) transport ATPase C|uniref:MgtC/SapB family protein n=1 Tax=uncultured Leptotrichia sp. TaxID=159271 RepID=UPI00260E006A|nr:MgtC/SapB family protein [uncultured Leptotrichia sp.]